MSELVLYAADASTLTMLAQRVESLPGVRVEEEHRRRERRSGKRLMYDRGGKRGGRDRRIGTFRGVFAFIEAQP